MARTIISLDLHVHQATASTVNTSIKDPVVVRKAEKNAVCVCVCVCRV